MRNTILVLALALFSIAWVPTCGTESLPPPPGSDAGSNPEPTPTPSGSPTPTPTPTGGPAAVCFPADAGCGGNGDCCSNRCPSGFCGALALADGQACTKATDCATLSCNGTCGAGGLCKQDGQDCPSGANLECCSNSCVGGRCVADKTGCHPAGERCSGGGFAVDGCCGGASCVNPGQATAHCGLPSDICLGKDVPCSSAQECCSNSCQGGTCQ
jgi:hypothetical protein